MCRINDGAVLANRIDTEGRFLLPERRKKVFAWFLRNIRPERRSGATVNRPRNQRGVGTKQARTSFWLPTRVSASFVFVPRSSRVTRQCFIPSNRGKEGEGDRRKNREGLHDDFTQARMHQRKFINSNPFRSESRNKTFVHVLLIEILQSHWCLGGVKIYLIYLNFFFFFEHTTR